MARTKPTPLRPEQSGTTGTGGELHQQPTAGGSLLTTNQGVVIADNQNSLKAAPRGPTLLEDFILREKITHFDHERIPERIVHARGSGAHGFFELTQSLSQYTKADLLQRVGEKTPVFVRFSTVAGGAGSGDLARDVRGFATKFYTQQGNFDLVGNNIPVFFIQDAMKFPDLVHSVKMEPDRGYPQAASAHDTFWDFVSLMPESMHMIMWAMSDRAIPRSLRMIEGFGVNTFRLIDANGKPTFVKFHWRPKLGMQSVIWDEAVKISGADPDFHRRDLFEAIKAGDFPEWDFGVQLFDERQAASFDFDVLDATKLVPEELVPLKIVGRMVLDRNPDNFFAETEQIAFCPANVVPGIDFSNDPLLQGRLFSYLDTQLIRLGGPNFNEIPVNQPKCPWANLQRDGHMPMRVAKGRVNYEPNTLAPEASRADPTHGFAGLTRAENGDTIRIRPESFADHYTQARMFFLSQTEAEKNHIVSALVFELSKVETPAVRERVVSQLLHVDEGMQTAWPAGCVSKRRLNRPPQLHRRVAKSNPRLPSASSARHQKPSKVAPSRCSSATVLTAV
jgi:catalase